MKFLLVSMFLFCSCAIKQGTKQMKEHVLMKEEVKDGGTITYADIEHFRFDKQPKAVAFEMIDKKCPKGYEVLKKTQDVKAHHEGFVSVNNPWVTLVFKCK